KKVFMSADINLIKSVLSLHDEMASNGFSLVYEGEFSHEVMKMFTSMAERDMDKSNEDKSVKRKVFHVMVECLQNMTKHSDDVDRNDGVGNGLFIVGKKDGYWSVITANKILKEKIEGLKASIDNINSLNKDDLNALYKKQIREGSLSDKGGAGLGLIDIARKTGRQLDYQFLPLEDKTNYFFLLKVRIDSKPDEE
ncbi:MAG: SiaB family protein kinase, partial [Paludibacteraceae bacterium]|nr:SiaB family protein kinase [Paludibacteraceae bacterium]